MRLRYTPRALAELDDVLSYIAERSPQGARRVHARVRTIIDLLTEHPYAGKPTSAPRLRRIVAAPFPYLVFYEVAEDEVIIIGIRHGARDPISMPSEEDS